MITIRASMPAVDVAGVRLRDALRAWCAATAAIPALVSSAGESLLTLSPRRWRRHRRSTWTGSSPNMFRAEGTSLVRLARLFVDDRNAAEDLVQEAFIRLARSARRIEDPARAPAYLRSIVLNLARDHNRRGRVATSPLTGR